MRDPGESFCTTRKPGKGNWKISGFYSPLKLCSVNCSIAEGKFKPGSLKMGADKNPIILFFQTR